MLLLLLGSMPKSGGRGGLQHLGGESLQRRRGLRSRGSCCPNFWDVAVGVDSRSRGTYRGWRGATYACRQYRIVLLLARASERASDGCEAVDGSPRPAPYS
eukprot:COSAG01_NODE_6356_length_3715_cov_2.853706_4_plen_101_part_00